MAIGYSREEMERMQSDAIRRVREMQQRAQNAMKTETPGPSRGPGGNPAGQGYRSLRPQGFGLQPAGHRAPAEKPVSKGFNLLNMLNLKSLQFGSDTLLVLMVLLILSSEECDELLLLALLYIIL